ncbi:hypothetical protein K3495_g9332 [Podosphaera aphanis]|nr:hypothetical protein K3495_g9332 [Podosphaera aphanis]
MKRPRPEDNDQIDPEISGPSPKKVFTGPNNFSQLIEGYRNSSKPHKYLTTIEEEDSSPDPHKINHFPNETEFGLGVKEFILHREVKFNVNETPTKSLRKHPEIPASPPEDCSVIKRLFRDSSTVDKNINRSARRKSAKALIEQSFLANESENEEDQEYLARQICDSEDNEEEENISDNLNEISPKPLQVESKTLPKKRQQEQISCWDLTAPENYFYQNKVGRPTTSNNTLSSLELLDHEEYFSRSRRLKNEHDEDLENLQLLHIDNFNRWQFELSQNFNLCLYGFGSKKSLLLRFADYLASCQAYHGRSRIVVINGYMKNLGIRDILKTVTSAITDDLLKFGPPVDMLETLFELFAQNKSWSITLIVHSIDGHSLRRPAHQYILGRLCSHPQIHLVASADHISFPLLWDSSLRFLYNFLFHDCTTFQIYSAEIDVIEEVHGLFGRSGRRAGGREGVNFVLKSLPENARKLFRVLIQEQLSVTNENSIDSEEDADKSDNQAVKLGKTENGIGYRVLYQRAVEEFICSNEMNFRILLKEFYDHQMIQSKKDSLGTEILFVPFRKEELEDILNGIVT